MPIMKDPEKDIPKYKEAIRQGKIKRPDLTRLVKLNIRGGPKNLSEQWPLRSGGKGGEEE